MEELERLSAEEIRAIEESRKQIEAGSVKLQRRTEILSSLIENWKVPLVEIGASSITISRSPETRRHVHFKKERVAADRAAEPKKIQGWLIGMTDPFKKEIDGMDKKIQGRILTAISDISTNPMTIKGDTVKPLSDSLKGLWRYRIGDFRIIYEPNPDTRTILLMVFGPRGEVYS